MIRFLFYTSLVFVPGALFVYLIHMYRKSKKPVRKLREETPPKPVPREPLAEASRRKKDLPLKKVEECKAEWRDAVKATFPDPFQQGYDNMMRQLQKLDREALEALKALAIPKHFIAGASTGNIPMSSLSINWKNLGDVLEKRKPEDVYVLSVDDFDRMRADLKLHRETENRPIEAKEKDGLVTMRLAGITYHIASDIFRMVKEFWDYQGPGGWHR